MRRRRRGRVRPAALSLRPAERARAARRQPARWCRRLLDRHAVRSRCPPSPRRPPRTRSIGRWVTRPRPAVPRCARPPTAVDRAPVPHRARHGERRCLRRHEGARRVAAAPAAPARSAARHRAVPRGGVPELRHGRGPRGLPRGAGPARRRLAPRPSTRSPKPTPNAPSLLWLNEPGNPTSSAAGADHFAKVAAWARARGVVVASDECYTEFAPEPATILGSGVDGVLAVHSLSKRSNLAGMRVGFYAGDPDLVAYLIETRKHAGLMAPVAMQAAAVAALGDDAHVAEQRARYAERRELAIKALARDRPGARRRSVPLLSLAAPGRRRRRRLGDRGPAGDVGGTAGRAGRSLRCRRRRSRAARAGATDRPLRARVRPAGERAVVNPERGAI